MPSIIVCSALSTRHDCLDSLKLLDKSDTFFNFTPIAFTRLENHGSNSVFVRLVKSFNSCNGRDKQDKSPSHPGRRYISCNIGLCLLHSAPWYSPAETYHEL
jgi:hypothetical protein